MNIDNNGTISVYFDGILKSSYKAGKNAGASFNQGFLVAEREGVSTMDSQLASRHLREMKFSGVTTSANALYSADFLSSSTTPCQNADIASTQGNWLTGKNMHGLRAGNGVSTTAIGCNYTSGTALW